MDTSANKIEPKISPNTKGSLLLIITKPSSDLITGNQTYSPPMIKAEINK